MRSIVLAVLIILLVAGPALALDRERQTVPVFPRAPDLSAVESEDLRRATLWGWVLSHCNGGQIRSCMLFMWAYRYVEAELTRYRVVGPVRPKQAVSVARPR